MEQIIDLFGIGVIAFVSGFFAAIKIVGWCMRSINKPLRQYLIMRILGFREGDGF